MTVLCLVGALGALCSAMLVVIARRAWVAGAALGGALLSLAALTATRAAGQAALALALGGVGVLVTALATVDAGPLSASRRARGAVWALGALVSVALLGGLLSSGQNRIGLAPDGRSSDVAGLLLGRYGPAAIGVALLGLAAIVGARFRKEE